MAGVNIALGVARKRIAELEEELFATVNSSVKRIAELEAERERLWQENLELTRRYAEMGMSLYRHMLDDLTPEQRKLIGMDETLAPEKPKES